MLKADPKVTVQESQGANFHVIGMNNININITMRKAISYAINYSILTEEEWPNISMRSRSPIPEGIIYSNTTAFNIPDYNISLARQTLLDVNWSGTAGLSANDNVSAGNEWEMLVSNDTPLEIYNISHFTSSTLAFMASFARENLRQIGIKVNLIGRDMRYWANHLYVAGWGYDYNDPHNALYPLYSSKSSDNMVYGSHLNDTLVDQWIEEAVKDTNPVSRKQTYYKIQERLIEELYVSAWTITFKRISIYDSNLRGWQPNPIAKHLFKAVYFV